MYHIEWHRETAALHQIAVDDSGTQSVRPVPCGDLYASLVKAQSLADHDFLMAFVVVTTGERLQRVAIGRKTSRNTRNILLDVRPSAYFLKEWFNQVTTDDPPIERKKMNRELQTLMTSSMDGVRKTMNLGTARPPEFSYRITEDFVCPIDDQSLQRWLRTLVTHGDITETDLLLIAERLTNLAPQQAEQIMTVIRDTRSREHISAISVHSLDEKLLVTIVNRQGNRLTVPEHKFRDLMKHPDTPRLLHTFAWQDRNKRDAEVVFNQHTDGVVVAKLQTATCQLVVKSLDRLEGNAKERSCFVLDLDYCCCLFLVLQRHRDDRERYDRLREEADAALSTDPFLGMF